MNRVTFGPRIRHRLLAIAAIALVLAPGTWLRDPPLTEREAQLRFVPLAVEQPADWPSSLNLEAAWELDSKHPALGGISAMVWQDGGESFHLFSDKGQTSVVPVPDRVFGFDLAKGTSAQVTAPVLKLPREDRLSQIPDLESAVVDPESGTLWLGYENYNAIRRLAPDGRSDVIFPEQMRHLPANSGIEAMMRLEDGRFVMLAERSGEGFLFARDPLAGEAAMELRFSPPGDFDPTAMALLPDGRAVILLRALRRTLPPFASMLVLADPAQIREDEDWPYSVLAQWDGADLRENYEGMAVEPTGDGSANIWLISDDNLSVLQRTLLLKLRFDYAAESETARED